MTRYVPFVILWVLLSPVVADEEELKTVAMSGNVVLASSERSVLIGDRATKKWRRISFPERAGKRNLSCEFVSETMGYGLVSFAVDDKSYRDLHFCRLNLQTEEWEHQSAFQNFLSCKSDRSGQVFVLSKDGVFCSRDVGQSWEKLFERNIDKNTFFTRIDRHWNGDVILTSVGPTGERLSRLMFNQDQKEWSVKPFEEPSITTLRQEYSTSSSVTEFGRSSLPMWHATTANYFDNAFNDSTSLPGLQVTTEKRLYRASARSRLTVHAQLSMVRPSGQGFPVADSKEVDCWKLHLLTPSGKFIQTPMQRTSAATDYIEYNLGDGKPLDRVVPISVLHRFDAPGQYKVQLIYDSSRNSEISRSVWHGRISSDVFDVFIDE